MKLKLLNRAIEDLSLKSMVENETLHEEDNPEVGKEGLLSKRERKDREEEMNATNYAIGILKDFKSGKLIYKDKYKKKGK